MTEKLVRHTRCAPSEEQEKNAGAGFNGIAVAPHQSVIAEGKKASNWQRPASQKRRAMKRGCETSMNHSKKSDKHFRSDSTTLDGLLIKRNFLRKHVSNIVECSGRELHYTANLR
jgi:hypothetical protein